VKSTSGKHLTTVACNDYALKTFEEAWESNRAEVVLLHESVSIRPVFFISQSQNECHVPAGIIWLPLLSRLLSTSTRPPTKTGRAAKCTQETHKAASSLERVDRRIHYSITHGIRMQNGEQKRDTLTYVIFI